MIYIIGSGPAGISTAVALVRAGLPVSLLDGGVNLEPEIAAQVSRLQDTQKSDWDQQVLQSFRSKIVSDQKGLQRKLIYGSDFPYAEAARYVPCEGNHIGHLEPSLAVGGFSNVWGSAILPFSEKDIESWPISLADLEPHYRAVLEFMPLTAERDELERYFPLYSERSHTLKRSAQAEKLFASASRSREHLLNAKLISGAPRLAVESANCVYCGLCLFGCPKCIIYSTRSTLARLLGEKNFHYLPNAIVTKLEEGVTGVRISAIERTTKSRLSLEGESVFLAAGALPSANILFSSFPERFRERELLVSEYFLLPLLQRAKTPGVEKEELHTLAQMFLECFDPNVSSHSVHMQLYTYSELYSHALEKMFRLLGPAKGILKNALLSRLLAIQGYLHSDESSRISLRKKGELLTLDGRVNPRARETIRKVTAKLFRNRRELGFTPVSPMLQIGAPGEGRHVGGSFPMKLNPAIGESEISGRLYGCRNIFLADASVFPTIPASTITFTAMANAHRIASAYALELSS